MQLLGKWGAGVDMSTRIIYGDVWEQSAFSNAADIVDQFGEAILPDDIDEISYSVTEKATGDVVVDAEDLDPEDVLFDSPQSPVSWVANTNGYNFRHDYAGLPEPNKRYVMEYTFTPANGNPFVGAVYEIRTKKVLNPVVT